jgi:hypothetical protein
MCGERDLNYRDVRGLGLTVESPRCAANFRLSDALEESVYKFRSWEHGHMFDRIRNSSVHSSQSCVRKNAFAETFPGKREVCDEFLERKIPKILRWSVAVPQPASSSTSRIPICSPSFLKYHMLIHNLPPPSQTQDADSYFN